MAASKVYLVGAGQPSLEDVVHVIRGLEVALDSAAADRVKKDSPPPKSFQADEPRDASGDSPLHPGDCLDQAQTRAAILFKLVSLVNGKSKARVSVLQTLVSLLNARINPCLRSGDLDQQALAALADALQGLGCVVQQANGGSVVSAADALQAAGIEAPGLSAAERAALQDGQCASGGTGAICVQFGGALLTAAGAVAALAAEALQADVKCFDADIVESQPHKGAVAVAEYLRALLDGSRQVNPRKGGAGVLPALSEVPAVHGAAADALAAATAPVKAALATAALPAAKDGGALQAGSPAMAAALLAAAPSLLRVAKLSLQRSGLIVERLQGLPSAAAPAGEGAADGATPTSSPSGAAAAAQTALNAERNVSSMAFDAVQQRLQDVAARAALAEGLPLSLAAAQAAYSVLSVLRQAIGVEALAAVVCLRLQEGTPAAPAAPAAPAVAEPANGAPAGGKADKKKEKKKGGAAAGMGLGRGSTLLRIALEAVVAAAGAEAPAPAALEAALGLLSLEDASAVRVQLQAASMAVRAQLDPAGSALARHLAALAAVADANAAQRKPKIAKGARDFFPDQMAIREVAFNKIVGVFKRHGAVAIDTPVFELRETLMGKYGEDSKLIYDLADQGGEMLSLRYDLTVPFARYVAIHGITNIKRYHIAKVYRRDQPQMTRGRFREFFQCDFDIAGVYPSMVPDAEVITVLVEILRDLDLGEFEVKLNHRKILDAIMEIAGVPAASFRPICSAIDKLDKEPWAAVRAEMVDEKGLAPEAADRIGEFVVLQGQPRTMLHKLSAEALPLAAHPAAAVALAELGLLFDYLEDMGALGAVTLDMSLARGLDYYTGVIYEAVLKGGGVGSIAAGGRYDGLVGMFSTKEVPAVGVSIGIERVFAIMEGRMRAQAEAAGGTIRETETQVLVASIGSGMQRRRMALAAKLWAAGVKAEFGFKANPKMADQLGHALKSGIPFLALFGEDEVARGVVKLKDLDAGSEEEVAEEALAALVVERVAGKGERRIVYQTDGAGAGQKEAAR